MTNLNYQIDKDLLLQALANIPKQWDGKEAILKLKAINYQWRQMEWMAWYFEVLCSDLLRPLGFQIPGERYGNVEFDSFHSINWDMKTSAIKLGRHKVILNDQIATDHSLDHFGYHGIILTLVEVEYDDDHRSFQQWHSCLKGGLSSYERARIARTANSRRRKISAEVKRILLLVVSEANKQYLSTYRQGRNSDGLPRNPKYTLDVAQSHHFEVGRIDF